MKKTISCLILCAMVLAVIPFSAFASNDTFSYTTADADYTLTTVDDLKAFNAKNATDGVVFTGTIQLVENSVYDMDGYTWLAGGSFEGTFNGNGATIKNLTLEAKDGAGMFNRATGEIKNFTVDTVTVSSGSHVGAIIGGNLSGDRASGELTVSGVHIVNAALKASAQLGGIIGNTNCNAGTVTIRNCSFAGSVTGTNRVGGLVGYSTGSTQLNVEKCAVNASVTGTGQNSNNGSVGGAIGHTKVATNVNDCVVMGQINATYRGSAGIIGYIETGSSIKVNIYGCFVDVTMVGGGEQKGGIIGRAAQTSANKLTLQIDNCVVNVHFNTQSTSVVAGIVAWANIANASGKLDLGISDCTISAVNTDEQTAYAFVFVNSGTQATIDLALNNVWYNSDVFKDDGGVIMIGNDTEVTLASSENCGGKTTEELEAASAARFYGYQVKENVGEDTTTYDYRLVGTLTLPEGMELSDIKDLGFYVSLTDGTQLASEKIDCGYTVYNSVEGGGITYYTGEGTNTASIEYVGGEYIFVIVINDAPSALTADITTYMTTETTENNEVTEVVSFGAPQRVELVKE